MRTSHDLAFLARAAALILCALLVACQSSDTGVEEILDAGQAGGELRPEVLGSGPTEIVLMLPLSGAGAAESLAIRNGAALAIDDLSDGTLRLSILEATKPESMSGLSPKAVAIPRSFTASPVADAIPVIAFVESYAPRPDGSFAFLSSRGDALVAGIRHAADKSGDIAVFMLEGSGTEGIDSALRSAGIDARIVSYRPEDAAASIAGRVDGSIAVAAFADSGAAIPAIVAAIRDRHGPDVRIVGNPGWMNTLTSDPKLAGAIIARPDTGNHSLVVQRYQQRFGSPPTEMALYGYDFVAVISGIVRSRGPAALTRETLLSPSGFRGATGAFRFRDDGSVERLFEILAVTDGRLRKIRDAQEGF